MNGTPCAGGRTLPKEKLVITLPARHAVGFATCNPNPRVSKSHLLQSVMDLHYLHEAGVQAESWRRAPYDTRRSARK